MAVRITHKDILTSAFGEAIRKVLQEPSYRAAAGLISRKLRARKCTPVQEAAGVLTPLWFIHKQCCFWWLYAQCLAGHHSVDSAPEGMYCMHSNRLWVDQSKSAGQTFAMHVSMSTLMCGICACQIGWSMRWRQMQSLICARQRRSCPSSCATTWMSMQAYSWQQLDCAPLCGALGG